MNRQANESAQCYVGLISGTSMDGIDAVVADFSGPDPVILAAETVPFDSDVHDALFQLRENPDLLPTAALASLDASLGEAFARAALTLIDRAGFKRRDIAAIGSHGQTVVHRPNAEPPYTLQIGDAHRIARRTGIVTVADFRRADLVAGGQGAPLAPLLHDAMLRSAAEDRAVVNLGGIANITLLPQHAPVSGFDTGPANCLLDEWYRRHHDRRYDHAGQWAASGQADPAWLAQLLDEPYFARNAPKSTGIEYFSPQWLDARLPDWASGRPADIQATLAELSARTVAGALLTVSNVRPQRVLICGGGIDNRDLIRRLEQHLPEIPCESTAEYGIAPDHVESMLFAWLARMRIQGRRIDTRTITGAGLPVLAGTIAEP